MHKMTHEQWEFRRNDNYRKNGSDKISKFMITKLVDGEHKNIVYEYDDLSKKYWDDVYPEFIKTPGLGYIFKTYYPGNKVFYVSRPSNMTLLDEFNVMSDKDLYFRVRGNTNVSVFCNVLAMASGEEIHVIDSDCLKIFSVTQNEDGYNVKIFPTAFQEYQNTTTADRNKMDRDRCYNRLTELACVLCHIDGSGYTLEKISREITNTMARLKTLDSKQGLSEGNKTKEETSRNKCINDAIDSAIRALERRKIKE